MLILPPGHAQAIRSRRAYTRREKWTVGGVLGLVAIGAVVVAIAIATTGGHSHNGCLNFTYAGPVGAQEINECGAPARDLCGSVLTRAGFTPAVAREVAEQCRKAGIPTAAAG
jgi:hypothetical protein